MDVAARLASKGQITMPKALREALSLEENDQIVVRPRAGPSSPVPPPCWT